jgi:tRNA threonylcarbamoyladenosine biosynthesis protein TsaE
MVEFVYDLDDIKEVASIINQLIGNCSIITFTGPLGAGKTTLIRALLQSRLVVDEVTSPTFSYMHHYQAVDNRRFYHFDLYRLDSIDQFIAAGFDEYLEQPGVTVFIEWPEIIKPLLTQIGYCDIILDYDNKKRKLIVNKHG